MQLILFTCRKKNASRHQKLTTRNPYNKMLHSTWFSELLHENGLDRRSPIHCPIAFIRKFVCSHKSKYIVHALPFNQIYVLDTAREIELSSKPANQTILQDNTSTLCIYLRNNNQFQWRSFYLICLHFSSSLARIQSRSGSHPKFHLVFPLIEYSTTYIYICSSARFQNVIN